MRACPQTDFRRFHIWFKEVEKLVTEGPPNQIIGATCLLCFVQCASLEEKEDVVYLWRANNLINITRIFAALLSPLFDTSKKKSKPLVNEHEILVAWNSCFIDVYVLWKWFSNFFGGPSDDSFSYSFQNRRVYWIIFFGRTAVMEHITSLGTNSNWQSCDYPLCRFLHKKQNPISTVYSQTTNSSHMSCLMEKRSLYSANLRLSLFVMLRHVAETFGFKDTIWCEGIICNGRVNNICGKNHSGC